MTDEQTQSDEQTSGQGSEGDGGEASSEAQEKAQAAEEERQEAKEEIKKLEEDPPQKLEDWPSGKAKYETFGGPEGEHTYEEGPESKLGPSSLRHHAGGEVTIEGEKVDDPDEYKGDPIPGGPTDPNAPDEPSGASQS